MGSTIWDADHYSPAHDVPGEDAEQTILKGLENGHDMRGLPLAILEQILPKVPSLRFSSHIGEKGTDLFRVASERGLERLSDMLVSQVPAENIEAVSEEWAK